MKRKKKLSDSELNNFIAEKIRGWRRGECNGFSCRLKEDGPHWIKDGSFSGFGVDDWKPATNLNHTYLAEDNLLECPPADLGKNEVAELYLDKLVDKSDWAVHASARERSEAMYEVYHDLIEVKHTQFTLF